jgi:hypothetical protein
MMTKMVQYKGNHRIEVTAEEAIGGMPGSFWFDIDNPRVERDFKKRIASALRSLRAAYIEATRVTDVEARRKFDADYNRGTLFFRDAANGRPMRFVEYRVDVGSARWSFHSPVPTALDTTIPNYDLQGLLTDLNSE